MTAPLLSWGRYPRYLQRARTCAWRGEIADVLRRMVVTAGHTLPFGNGRSYGDSCLAVSDRVLPMRAMNRFIQADWQAGVVIVEAGMTLAELLRVAIPRGWFLAVTPGTQFATLGGALANDVHGKNHHKKGTFGCHVRRFGLIRSDRPPLTCSAEENSELFAATIGGLGLTGVVDWIELELVAIGSSAVDVLETRFDNLDDFFALSAELDPVHEYAVAWIDCLARGAATGRGVYMAGDHAPEGGLRQRERTPVDVVITPPVSAINRFSLRWFNSAYYRRHRPGRQRRRIEYDAFFYPLDRVLNWNRIYGPRGFQQYQCAIPDASAAPAITELLGAIATANSGSFLAVLKRFGDRPSPGLLSFPLPGTTLALDFPQQGEATASLFAHLDAIVRAAGGRLYPAKDAHMSGADFRAWYPAWEQVQALRDPLLASRFWQRVTT